MKIEFIPHTSLCAGLDVRKTKVLKALKEKTEATMASLGTGEFFTVILEDPKMDFSEIKNLFASGFTKGTSIWIIK